MAETTVGPDGQQQQRSLGASARASLLWSGSFTLMRDVAQFALMLVLVRLLKPADYGAAALVQSIIGFFAIVSYSAFSLHALQVQNPKNIDWQAHFTAASIINTIIFGIVLLLALGLNFVARYREVAFPLAALGLAFLIEIPGTLRHRMLEANHEWKRYRVLLTIGTLLGMGAGLAVALLGGGVWALILQPLLFGLPATIDLFVVQRFQPDWSWSWERYRETVWFGMNRIASGATARVRPLAESSIMAGVFDLATLGIFSRAMGLSMLLVGRIGGVATSSLHPVLTRASSGSPRFRRLADLTFRGVSWVTFPIAALLLISSQETVLLLYGAKWEGVIPLLRYATVVVALVSLSNALASLFLANQFASLSVWLEIFGGAATALLAVILVPFGPKQYLIGLIGLVSVAVVVSIALMVRTKGMTLAGVVSALLPPAVAVATSGLAVYSLEIFLPRGVSALFRLLAEGLLFGVVYLVTLRVGFRSVLQELLEVAPAGRLLNRIFIFRSAR